MLTKINKRYQQNCRSNCYFIWQIIHYRTSVKRIFASDIHSSHMIGHEKVRKIRHMTHAHTHIHRIDITLLYYLAYVCTYTRASYYSYVATCNRIICVQWQLKPILSQPKDGSRGQLPIIMFNQTHVIIRYELYYTPRPVAPRVETETAGLSPHSRAVEVKYS